MAPEMQNPGPDELIMESVDTGKPCLKPNERFANHFDVLIMPRCL